MKKAITIFLAITTVAGLAVAQQADVAELKDAAMMNPLGVSPAPTPSSLLDLSRVTFSHSYSISFFSGGNTSGSVGLLRSSMLYEFSPKLSLVFNLGVLHNPGSLWNSEATNRDATLLPGFVLDYHPSDKFRMSVSFQRYSGYYSPFGSSYYRPRPSLLFPD